MTTVGTLQIESRQLHNNGVGFGTIKQSGTRPWSPEEGALADGTPQGKSNEAVVVHANQLDEFLRANPRYEDAVESMPIARTLPPTPDVRDHYNEVIIDDERNLEILIHGAISGADLLNRHNGIEFGELEKVTGRYSDHVARADETVETASKPNYLLGFAKGVFIGGAVLGILEAGARGGKAGPGIMIGALIGGVWGAMLSPTQVHGSKERAERGVEAAKATLSRMDPYLDDMGLKRPAEATTSS